MPDHYLVRCLRQFEEVSRSKYDGKSFDLESIERDVSTLRTKRRLRVSDLEPFRKKEHWWFERYWVLPSSTDVDPHLCDKTFDFHQLSKKNEGTQKERTVINDLLSAFRSIELVSIILRFIRPESFGILSPPVERVLDVRRGSDAVETYMNYLRDLRKIRDHHCERLPRAADADKALWVLHEKCFSETFVDTAIKEEFQRDVFMQRIRAANLVAPLEGLSLPRLAEALETVRNDLAALVGCYAFEDGVRRRAELEDIPLTNRDGTYRKLNEIIDELRDRKAISSFVAGNWHRLQAIRNKVFHAKVTAPVERDIRDLVEEVVKIDAYNKEL